MQKLKRGIHLLWRRATVWVDSKAKHTPSNLKVTPQHPRQASILLRKMPGMDTEQENQDLNAGVYETNETELE